MRTNEFVGQAEHVNSVSFGVYVFDFESNKLTKNGQVLHLQNKPAEILAILLKSRGSLVRRADLIHQVWGTQVVDFDQNINFSIKCIRKALDDNPNNPTYVQTIPRKGYRFIAESDVITNNQDTRVGRKKPSRMMAVFIAVISVAGLSLWWFESNKVVELTSIQPSADLQELKRAIYLLEKREPESIQKSFAIFNRIKGFELASAEANAGMAIATIMSDRDPQAKSLAIDYARQALLKNSENGLVQLSMGMVTMYFDWDIPLAQQYFRKATELAPNSIMAWHELSVTQTIQNQYTDALASIQHALNLDPGKVQEVYHIGWFFLVTNQYQKALDQCVKSIEIAPDHVYGHLCAVNASIKLGLNQTAQKYMLGYMHLVGASDVDIETTANNNDPQMGDRFYRWRVQFLLANRASHFSLALAYAQAGETALSLSYLQQAVEHKNLMVPTAWAYEPFQAYKHKPQFIKILQDVSR